MEHQFVIPVNLTDRAQILNPKFLGGRGLKFGTLTASLNKRAVGSKGISSQHFEKLHGYNLGSKIEISSPIFVILCIFNSISDIQRDNFAVTNRFKTFAKRVPPNSVFRAQYGRDPVEWNALVLMTTKRKRVFLYTIMTYSRAM